MAITQQSLIKDEQTAGELRQSIREGLLTHLAAVGLASDQQQGVILGNEKAAIRSHHAMHRAEYRQREVQFVQRRGLGLLRHFADGRQIVPEKVWPTLHPVVRDTEDADLFRFATLLWSVPVSRGYGRRMRYLVRDGSNGKLIGLFALADPVFNLRARDAWIGWTSNDRKSRLVNVMDAHVVGAVPPYDRLLGGKVVTSLMTSRDVGEAFASKYSDTEGGISHERKHAKLVLITVTSALGRSSLYNRLKLPGLVDFERIGMTEGWGHFQVPDHLFGLMRRLLELEEHKYASGYKYGQGPNWRMRVVREALLRVDLNPNEIMRHGISREVFAAPLAANWRDYLCGRVPSCVVDRPTVSEIASAAINRWIVPRSQRMPEYQTWTRYDTWRMIVGPDADL